MINDEKKAEFKVRLLSEKEVLEEELKGLGMAKPEGEEFGADMTDNSDVIADEMENNSAAGELKERLMLVNRALEKFETDTFGICEISDEPIEDQRLHANPAARTCIAHMDDEITLGM